MRINNDAKSVSFGKFQLTPSIGLYRPGDDFGTGADPLLGLFIQKENGEFFVLEDGTGKFLLESA